MPALERPGEPLVCRICGDSKWVAEYLETVCEDVLLVRDADGKLRVEDWLGGRHADDRVRTDEECYRCLECGEELSAEREGNKHPGLLLRRFAGILSRGNRNVDTLDAIAEILRESGFEIPGPDEEGTG